MKRIYWRPRGISRTVLALIAVLSMVGMGAVERFRLRTQQPYFEEKLEASRLALKAMQILQQEREPREPDIDPINDPTGSGLIGLAMTAVTSDPGSLPAKQTTINPNFAAILVQWLHGAGVKNGDVVAVGVSGSFPALNVCVYAALQTMGVKPVVVSSAAASQWGANLPDFIWLDMEKVLADNNIFTFRSVAASIGGVEDRGLGMASEGRKLLEQGIHRNGVELIDSKSFTDSIDRRMAIYNQKAAGSPIKAYINVGGGTTSVGTSIGKRMFEPGLNLKIPPGAQHLDAVMTRFARDGVPVIHLTNIAQIASEYGLPTSPRTIPEVGAGRIFYGGRYNLWLAGGVLLAILGSLYAFIHTEIGYRLLQTPARSKDAFSQEPMI